MIYICIGRRELGKTTLAYSMLSKLPKRAIIDARRMIHQPGADYSYDATDAVEALHEMMQEPLAHECIYQPHEDDLEGAFVTWTKALKGIVIDRPDVHTGILVDEASFYNLETSTFQWLAKCALRDYTHIIITAHQPKDIPTSIRAIADHWFIFYTSQKTDIDAIEAKSSEAAREVKRLTGRSFVHWDDAHARLQINSTPSTWYVPLNNRATAVVRVAPDGKAPASLFNE